ncbi:hypothetical protein, partial [Mixta calida]|uniref:hypothetical protein n=1 Tax=Mixta calida TaxID=665913 RepID=UPI0028A60798
YHHFGKPRTYKTPLLRLPSSIVRRRDKIFTIGREFYAKFPGLTRGHSKGLQKKNAAPYSGFKSLVFQVQSVIHYVAQTWAKSLNMALNRAIAEQTDEFRTN